MLRGRRGVEVPFRVHTTTTLPEIDRTCVGAFRCVSATRTIIDLARARIGRYRLEAAIDSAVRSGASAPLVLERRLGELRSQGRWGVRLLDRLLVDTGGHTMLERRFIELAREAGLPRPTPQVIFQRDGRAFARVDFHFRPYDVVVEVSGRLGHSSPAERARDAQRRNELQDAGQRVYEYTWEDVTERPRPGEPHADATPPRRRLAPLIVVSVRMVVAPATTIRTKTGFSGGWPSSSSRGGGCGSAGRGSGTRRSGGSPSGSSG